MACTFIAPICITREPYLGILPIRQTLCIGASPLYHSMTHFQNVKLRQPPFSATHLSLPRTPH